MPTSPTGPTAPPSTGPTAASLSGLYSPGGGPQWSGGGPGLGVTIPQTSRQQFPWYTTPGMTQGSDQLQMPPGFGMYGASQGDWMNSLNQLYGQYGGLLASLGYPMGGIAPGYGYGGGFGGYGGGNLTNKRGGAYQNLFGGSSY